MALYIQRYEYQIEMEKERELNAWRRFRIQWSDFRNANRGKNKRPVNPSDLIKLPEDERPAKYHEIDMDAVKRRFGSKIKKRGK